MPRARTIAKTRYVVSTRYISLFLYIDMYCHIIYLFLLDCGKKICSNFGKLNTNTCQCECAAPYVGDTCTKGKAYYIFT